MPGQSAKDERTEKQRIVRPLTQALERRGAWVEKISGSPYQARGLPDLLICYRGRFIMFECKRYIGDKGRPLQRYTMRQIRAAGGVAIVPDTVEDGLAILDEIDEELDG